MCRGFQQIKEVFSKAISICRVDFEVWSLVCSKRSEAVAGDYDIVPGVCNLLLSETSL